jgi:hypothetical protein
MKQSSTFFKTRSNRRSFLKSGMVAAGAATMGSRLWAGGLPVFGSDRDDDGPLLQRETSRFSGF